MLIVLDVVGSLDDVIVTAESTRILCSSLSQDHEA
jgi:hypothetical protein